MAYPFRQQRTEQFSIRLAIRRSGGNRENAARMLDFSVATLYRKISRHDAG